MYVAVKNTGRWLCCTLPPLRQAGCNGGPCVCAKGLPERGGAGCSRLGQSDQPIRFHVLAIRKFNLHLTYHKVRAANAQQQQKARKQMVASSLQCCILWVDVKRAAQSFSSTYFFVRCRTGDVVGPYYEIFFWPRFSLLSEGCSSHQRPTRGIEDLGVSWGTVPESWVRLKSGNML